MENFQEQTDRAAANFTLRESEGTHTVERRNGRLLLVNVQTGEIRPLGHKATFHSLLNLIRKLKEKA